MNSRLIFLETLLPLLSQLAKSPNPGLAAEAMDEVAAKSRELARLKRATVDAADAADAEGAGKLAAAA